MVRVFLGFTRPAVVAVQLATGEMLIVLPAAFSQRTRSFAVRASVVHTRSVGTPRGTRPL